MRFKFYMLVAFMSSLGFPQMPAVGTFYYQLKPREAKFGQQVVFKAYEFNMCLYDYDVTYELLPTPISSKKTTIVSMLAKLKPKCATLAGYSGPTVVFDSLEAGTYVLQFDSLSDFKKDLGDTNTFEVLSASMGISKNGFGVKQGNKESRFGNRRVDGKISEETSSIIRFGTSENPK